MVNHDLIVALLKYISTVPDPPPAAKTSSASSTNSPFPAKNAGEASQAAKAATTEEHWQGQAGSGAVLVFLPGLQDVTTLLERLTGSSEVWAPGGCNHSSNNDLYHHFVSHSSSTNGSTAHAAHASWTPSLPFASSLVSLAAIVVTLLGECIIVPLHSSLTSEEQKLVFNRPPKGVRKVILSTNIAETSVTVDDVVWVIDCGFHKEMRYDSKRHMAQLDMAPISRANAAQRAGRAGRVTAGVAFHLFTCHRANEKMLPFQPPEMMRTPLVRLD